MFYFLPELTLTKIKGMKEAFRSSTGRFYNGNIYCNRSTIRAKFAGILAYGGLMISVTVSCIIGNTPSLYLTMIGETMQTLTVEEINQVSGAGGFETGAAIGGLVGNVAGKLGGRSTGTAVGAAIGSIGGPAGAMAGAVIGGWIGTNFGTAIGTTVGGAIGGRLGFLLHPK